MQHYRVNMDDPFSHAVALVPGPVRERLDGDFPLDWTVIEDAGTGAEAGEAARVRRRLPQPVEALVRRLIEDIGIVPADVAGGVEREGAASAWIHWVSIEAEGESYLLRNNRSGDLHAGVHPGAVVGYAVLGMELVTALHDAAERWLDAGKHHRTVREDERSPLGHCAMRMHAYLRNQPKTISGHHTAASIARTLERAWNTQNIAVRTALADMRLGSAARGARAPQRGYYAPATGHRLHACDPGEIRWLRALARRAAAGADAARDAGRTAPAVRAAAASSGDPGVTAAGSGERAVIPESAPEPEGAGADTLKLDPDAGRSATETTMSELVHTAGRLHEAVRRRLTETGGARVEEALKRLQAPEAADALRAEMWPAAEGGRAAPAPQWLEALAASLLADTGAQTGEGLRTSGLRLDPARRPDGGHRATEVETGAFGYLAPAGLLEQVRLSLAFANDAWTGLTMLRNVGQESEWALNGVHNGSTSISTSEREVLETAQDIGLALDRIQRSHAGDGKSSALEQAAIVADAFDAIGPTARATAGWPGTAPAPNARSPEDIARAATVAKGLHEEVRSIADRLIAGELSTARV